MKLLDFLLTEATIDDLAAREKAEGVKEMVAKLVEVEALEKKQLKPVTEAVMARESLGSTGIGKGVAVPHAKHRAVTKVTGLVALSRSGVEFAAIDGELVHLLFLVVSPPDKPAEHLQALERIAVLLRDENLSKFLKRARNREEVAELLAEADQKFGDRS